MLAASIHLQPYVLSIFPFKSNPCSQHVRKASNCDENELFPKGIENPVLRAFGGNRTRLLDFHRVACKTATPRTPSTIGISHQLSDSFNHIRYTVGCRLSSFQREFFAGRSQLAVKNDDGPATQRGSKQVAWAHRPVSLRTNHRRDHGPVGPCYL